MNELLDCVLPRVTEDMNVVIEKDYVSEQVKRELFDMAPSEGPDIDEFSAGFYQ